MNTLFLFLSINKVATLIIFVGARMLGVVVAIVGFEKVQGIEMTSEVQESYMVN